MGRESNIVKRIRERITTKEAELPKIDMEIAECEQTLAELRTRRTGIEMGIREDEDLLRAAAPKRVRAKKTETPPAEE